MEAGKKRLQGDTLREANSSEVQELKAENEDSKELEANLSLDNMKLKKKRRLVKREKYMHYKQSENMEIIRLVEKSELGVVRTLRELKVNKATFYKWYNAHLKEGYEGLARK